jgi:hypothetical protein
LSYSQVVAVRPSGAATAIPAQLAGLPHAAAEYRAMPAYANFLGATLGRLAPVAGVLDYDANGDVVDLKAEAKTGQGQTDATKDPAANP